MERTLRITGKAKISTKPDQTCLQITCTGKDQDYDQLIRKSTEDTEKVKQGLEACGFDRKDIKTCSYDIETCFENHKRKNGDWVREFSGYEYTHELKVVFTNDSRRLSRIMQALCDSHVQPDVSITYQVSDPDSVKKELLRKAVEDASIKAEILTEAAHVQLMEIVQIDYSWQEVEFSSLRMNRSARTLSATSLDMEIEPEEVETEDTVTVVYRIA